MLLLKPLMVKLLQHNYIYSRLFSIFLFFRLFDRPFCVLAPLFIFECVFGCATVLRRALIPDNAHRTILVCMELIIKKIETKCLLQEILFADWYGYSQLQLS